MKIKKLLISIVAATPIIAVIPQVTSCNKNSIEQEAHDYIHDRSFSIFGIDKDLEYMCLGTAWILSDATKSQFDDFEYYIATNWHVQHGIEQLTKPVSYFYGDAESGFVDNYTEFASLTWESADNFCFSGSDTSKAIDMYVAKVKFGSDMPTSVKNKLTKLNKQQKAKGYINKFASKTSTDMNFANSKICIGGYPMKVNKAEGYSSGAWRYQEIAPKNTVYCDKEEHPHSIDQEKATPTIIDVSPQYIYWPDKIRCEYDSEEGWIPLENQWSLSGGSSGSMILVQENNEWVVGGIYWGGVVTGDIYVGTDPVYFHPAMSIFNSEYKNFVTPYIK